MRGIYGRIEKNIVYFLLEQRQNNKSACHPERSRTSVERIATQKREAF